MYLICNFLDQWQYQYGWYSLQKEKVIKYYGN